MEEGGGIKGKDDSIQQEASISVQWRYCLPQILACCIAHSLVINCGINLVFSAVLLPQLMMAGSQIPITSDDASWIASFVTIATPVGALMTGPMMDKLGRKMGCIICAFAMCLSWILMAISYSVPMLCFSRLVCGVTSGISTVALVYVSEISHPRIRPALLCLNSVFFSLGILLTCMSGTWLSWRTTSYCAAGFCVLLFLFLWLLPESPHWSAIHSQGNENSVYWEKAESSIQWLYRNELVIAQETECLKKNLREDNGWKPLSLSQCVKCFQRRSALKPFFLLIGLFVFQQLSGAYVLIFYAVHIFKKVGGTLGSSIDALQALIVMGVIRFVMSVLVSVLSHKFGRRPLLISSHAGMSITAFVLGICVYSAVPRNQSDLFKENDSDGQLLPIICILLFVCFSALGVLVIPWTLAVELLPAQIRGIGGGLMVSWAYFLMFATVKSFPYIVNMIGISGVFFALSTVCVLASVYVFLLLPETLGKTFTEIEKEFL